jgi:response regulator of citrate/malate metabolism
MSLDTQQAKNVLKNCRVLIAEDEDPLARRIARLIKDYSQFDPVITHYMEEARQIMANEKQGFDLVILDIMLPTSEEDVQDIQILKEKLQEKLGVLSEAIALSNQQPENKDAKIAVSEARDAQALILKQIDRLIDREGGIQLVKEWRAANCTFPILFLTAGSEAIVQRGLLAAGENSDAVVKPAPSEVIQEKCINLLQKSAPVSRS